MWQSMSLQSPADWVVGPLAARPVNDKTPADQLETQGQDEEG